MDEQKAIELVIDCWEKRVVPAEFREQIETAAIQTIAMIYLAGGEVVMKPKPVVTLGELGKDNDQLLIDGVIY